MKSRLHATLCLALAALAPAQDVYRLHTFEKRQLDTGFFCEGATAGDLDNDGKPDVVAGPYWYAGPDFATKHAFYAPKPFDPSGYSDNFFAFVHDFDGDRWNDILVIGFPGKDASWFRNPGAAAAGTWVRHRVFDEVDNESPTFTDLDGDGKPELVCQTKDRMGYASPDWQQPGKPWTFHPISVKGTGGRFTHGLGIGDVDGDGRKDVLWKHGWWQQPASLAGDPEWPLHLYNFAGRGRGGAQMHVYDVDGDGDNDVISSRDAHGFGLYWFEHVPKDGKITFVPHRIMDELPAHNRYGIAFGNLHALDLVDVDRDGLLDIVTGNRYFAHGGRDKADQGKAPLYWFELSRAGKDAHFVPHEIDAHSGVGTQVVATDLDGDGYPEVVVGNKMGIFVHQHEVESVSRKRWYDKRREELRAAASRLQPPAFDRAGGTLPRGATGQPLNLDFEAGDLRDWVAKGDAFAGLPVRGDVVHARRKDSHSQHQGEYWVGTYEPQGSDRQKGALESAPFAVEQRYASFLVGGGSGNATRVELVRVRDGAVIHTVSGRNREDLAPASVDLREHLGEQILIRLVDGATGGWGHVNFDDFRFHAKDPGAAGGGAADSSTQQLEAVPPTAAAARMTVRDGFRVELVAGEPEVHQPIAFCFDARGRLWVAEAHSYPVRAPGDKAKDQILVFEDTNGDGTFDKRSVFVADLNLVSGIEVGFGGVFVGAAPYLMFLADRDDDLRPDGEPEILLDGWGYEDTHETLNSFQWGPDGWLYGCHGVFTHSRVGKPGTPKEERTPINAGVWRFHPVQREFEVFAWGASNQWGVDFDDHGQAFITACVIPHLFHVIQGARYHRQSGSHFGQHVYEDIETIADHLHYLGARPHTGNGVSNAVGGGHAHCGAMVYLGDAYPEEFRGVLFMHNIHGNRVNTDHLRREGSGFVGSHGEDFLIANDKWFRGVALRYGPDGNVFLIDWYDKQACHRTRPELWDRSNGRIYKVSHGEQRTVAPFDLRKATDERLVELQQHANDWYVRQARLVLQERGGSEAVHGALAARLRTAPDVPGKLRALWALHATRGMSEAIANEALDSQHEHVRAWAVQLTTEDRQPGEALAARLAAMAAQDPSPVVRLYLASALQRVPGELRWQIARGLLAHGEDAGDHNLPLLLWYGVEPLVAEAPQRATGLLAACKLPKVERFVYRRLAALDAGRDVLVSLLAEGCPAERERWIAQEMAHTLRRRTGVAMPAAWPQVYHRLVASPHRPVHEDAQTLAVCFGDARVLPVLRAVLADRKAPLDRRTWALDNLLRVKDADTVPVLQALLDDEKLAERAIAGLAKFDDGKTPELLLTRYPAFSPAQQDEVVTTLSSRAPFAKTLLEAVVAGRLPKSILDPATTRRTLRRFADAGIDALLTKAWGKSIETAEDKQKVIDGLKKQLVDAVLDRADLENGRAVYARTCMTCHKLFGEGRDIGPDLTGSNRADLDYILTNIVDPSAEVAREYMLTGIDTADGGFFSGVIAEENETTITLKTAEGKREQIARADIGKDEDGAPAIQTLPVSMMPEGQLQALTDDQVRDLIAYLASDEQVPMAAAEGTLQHFFDGASLAHWDADPGVWQVEDGELVGRSAQGLKRNSFAISQMTFGDFRLVVDVKLAGNAGNSGIQFRSRPHGKGGMHGYQADIGPKWWGKLYEEEGRAVLHGGDHDAAARPGEWNTYEVVAVGHRVLTAINGVPCVDLVDEKGELRGRIGLQVHSGGPTEVRFRNFRFELAPKAELKTVPAK